MIETSVKAPPHNLVSERVVVGSALLDPQRTFRDCGNLSVHDFYSEQHRQIWEAVLSLHHRQERIDTISVKQCLEEMGAYDDDCFHCLADLMEEADPYIVKRESQKIIRDREVRDVIRTATNIIKEAHEPGANLTDLRAMAFEMSRGSEPGKDRFPSMTAAELDKGDFELEYLIPGMIVKNQPGLWIGPQKTLKTNTAIDLVLSLSSGFPFLGEFKVQQTVTSAFISGESGKATIQETARRVALSKGQPLSSFDDVFFVFNLPSLTSTEDLQNLRQLIESNSIEFLFLDPLYLMLDGIGDAAGNLFPMGPILRRLGEMMEELGVTVFLCHHTKNREKFRQYEPTELEDIAWSGFREFARQWVLLGRRSKYDPDSDGQHELWLNCGGSAGHSNLWGIDVTEGRRSDDNDRRWEIETIRASDARSQAVELEIERKEERKEQQALRTHEKRRQKILDAIGGFPEGETKSAIRQAVNMGGTTFNPIFDELLEEGTIQHTEIEKNGRIETAYSIGRTRSDNGRTNNHCPGGGRLDRTTPPLGGCLSDPTDRPSEPGAVGQKQKLSNREPQPEVNCG